MVKTTAIEPKPRTATATSTPWPAPCCANCHYMHRSALGSTTCRRNPPLGGVHYDNCRGWPPVLGTDCCGEHPWVQRAVARFAAGKAQGVEL